MLGFACVRGWFSRSDPFLRENDTKATEDDDLFHFIAYVPVNGKVYELDGIQEGPVVGNLYLFLFIKCLGSCDQSNWLDIAKTQIQNRMSRYAPVKIHDHAHLSYKSSEIRFNLMVVMKSRKSLLNQEKAQLVKELLCTETRQAQLSVLFSPFDNSEASGIFHALLPFFSSKIPSMEDPRVGFAAERRREKTHSLQGLFIPDFCLIFTNRERTNDADTILFHLLFAPFNFWRPLGISPRICDNVAWMTLLHGLCHHRFRSTSGIYRE